MYFLHDLAPFGAQRVALYSIKNMDKVLLSVSVCSFWHEETLKPEFIKAGAKVFPLRAKRFYDIFAWMRLLNIIQSTKPNIIYTTIPELGVITRFLRFLFPRLKVVHSFHNPMSSEPPIWQFLNRHTIGLCDAIVFSSAGIVADILKLAPYIKNRTTVIPNAVTLREHSEGKTDIRAEYNIRADTTVIVCNGRLCIQKGQDTLIASASILIKKGHKIILLLVGDGEDESMLKNKAAELNISDSVILTGRRGDIPQILGAANIYVAPSRWESFNIALGEAMLKGIPCIASDIPGHKDLLQNGKTGISVRKEDPEALAYAIEYALANPETLKPLIKSAKENVETNFTPSIMARAYEKMFLNILEKQ